VSLARSRGSVEPWIGTALVLGGGAGAILALGGLANGELNTAMAGGALLGFALTALVAAGWVEATLLVAVSLPLPALYSTESLRIATAAPVTAAVIGAWMLGLGVSGRRAVLGRLPVRSLLGLSAALLLATLTASYPLTSVRELFNFALLFLFLLVATESFSRERAAAQRAADALVTVGAICGVLAVLEMVQIIPGEFPRYDTAFNRAALGFGQPNGLGLFFAVIMPLALHRLRTAEDAAASAIALLAIGCLAAGLIATFSRGSWLATLAGAGALLFTGDRRIVLRFFAGVIAVVVLADIATGGAMRDTVERTIGDWVIEQRAALMLAGVVMFMAYPLTGVGPGGYAESLDRFGPQIPQLWDYLPTPHNAYVQMAAEAGIVGLIAFVLFLAVTLVIQVRRTRREDLLPGVTAAERSLNRAWLWSMATAIAAGMVVWPFAHGTGQAVMLIAGGIYAMPRRS
jgi:O-antigen ligase